MTRRFDQSKHKKVDLINQRHVYANWPEQSIQFLAAREMMQDIGQCLRDESGSEILRYSLYISQEMILI